MVPKEGFEPTHPFEYYVLNVARLPFRHFGLRHAGNFVEVNTEAMCLFPGNSNGAPWRGLTFDVLRLERECPPKAV